jgi:hypothetical protein
MEVFINRLLRRQPFVVPPVDGLFIWFKLKKWKAVSAVTDEGAEKALFLGYGFHF